MAGVTGKIVGKVTDAETGQPLPGVNVVVEGTALGAAADTQGDYFINFVPPGLYKVQAKMMGYETVTKTQVRVSIDRIITVAFQLKSTVLEGEEVTVVADRDVVRLDVSASQVTASIEQIEATPMVKDVNEFISLQAGIQVGGGDDDEDEETLIRGGGMDQVGLVVDGLPMVDNINNQPMTIVNLSAIEEVTIIKGGFNAEYGNIRSGLFNIVTKKGKPRYHASIDFRYGVPHQKHRGASIFSEENFWMRPYLDEDVCYVGTANSEWNTYAKRQYQEFEGWNAFSARLLSDDNPDNDLTPQQARDLFIWQHRAEGSEALGHPRPGKYGEDPDLNLDVSFSGPVPFIGKFLGDMTFFTSYRMNREQYVVPASTDYLDIRNGMIKLNSNLSTSMKLGLEYMVGIEKSAFGGISSDNLGGDRGMYFPHGAAPMDVNQSMLGLTFDHVLSPKTFYQVRLSMVNVENDQFHARVFRDTTPIRQIGSVWVDEQPWGFLNVPGYQYALADRMVIGGVGADSFNKNKINTYNFKFDITSQVNKYNEIKAGVELTADNFDVYYGLDGFDPTGNFEVDWEHTPIRIGAYVQDQLAFEGIIANVGLRLDYNDPNTEWYTADRYSQYFSRVYKHQLTTQAPTEPAKGHLTLSPRLGISHPISDVSKLFFHYGHAYSMPPSGDMYEIHYGAPMSGIERIGNPSLLMPRTIAYELGYEHEFADMFLVRLTGYYKDVTNQIGDVMYINYDESVAYNIAENDNYQDIRGFEIELQKTWGRWISGWLNYTYMVTTSGLIGRETMYQDPRQQAIYGKRFPYQEKPLPLPFARANIAVHTPEEFGPRLLGFYPLDQWRFSLLTFYNAGDYLTWEPLPPYKLTDNLTWKDNWNFDMRIQKFLSVAGVDFTLFADIVNVFNFEHLNGGGFEDEADFRDYMNSLHLPMYGEAKYQSDPIYTEGDDRVGDVWSEDKPYINMPNLNYLAWSIPRSIILGLKVNF